MNIRKAINGCLLLVMSLLLSACRGQPTGLVENESYDKRLSGMLSKKEVPFLSVDSLYAIQNRDIVILDTRSREEYRVSHIPGARWVGYDEFDLSKVKDISSDQEVVLYCSVGYRSQKVGEQMKKAGYSGVTNLYGSIFEWGNRGYPLQGVDGDSTRKIHAYNQNWGRWISNPELEKVYSLDKEK